MFAIAAVIAALVFIAAIWLPKVAKPQQAQGEAAKQHDRAEVGKSSAVHLTVRADQPGHAISSSLYGVFFEEINHAGEGGLYAELIANRSFEDDPSGPAGWSVVRQGGAKGSLSLTSDELLNSAQREAMQIHVTDAGSGGRVGAENDGFWGIRVDEGASYNLSFYAKPDSGYAGGLTAALESLDGTTTYAAAQVKSLEKGWHLYKLVLQANASQEDARFVLYADHTGTVTVDVVSLFPPTWNGRPNGLRTDLAQKVADLTPRFVRFPGGCFVEGDSVESAYQWKKTIGNIADRAGHWDLWGYRVTDGLGFHEFLQWAEDMGAEPLYVANIGISHKLDNPAGNYTTVPIDQLNPWIQDVLDAIEYANGPVTTKWGALRAKNGHPEPFNLKYVEIGNENNFQMSEYVQRYPLFYRAIKAKYPDITLIADAPVSGQPVDMVDEHYYSSPQWFRENAGKYDQYDRNGPKIYVGEYAATVGAGKGNLDAALGEAAFMTGLERNSDIVRMASYAPLFVNDNDRRWNPDAIVFNHAQSYSTPSYYVQQMFSNNKGDTWLPVDAENNGAVPKPKIIGGVGLGTWNTAVEYDDIRITSGGKTLFADSFGKPSDAWHPLNGSWSLEGGVYKQTETIPDARSTVIGEDWSDYTITLRARKTAGAEGMLIMFGVKDPDNYYWWNIGGWGNTQHAIEKAVGGAKSIVGKAVPGSVESGKWYDIKIIVEGTHIRCYLDGQLVIDATDSVSPGPLYYTASRDTASGDVIVKMVNTADQDKAVHLSLKGLSNIAGEAEATVLSGDDPSMENDFEHPERIAPVKRIASGIGPEFDYTFPKYSVTVLRIKTGK